MKGVLLGMLVLLSFGARAEVYRCQHGGSATYTDRPCAVGAKPAELPEISVVKTPGSKADLAKDYDKRVAREKKAKEKADQQWVKEYDAKKSKEDRIRQARSEKKVVKGMTAGEVRGVLGDPDSMTSQDGDNVQIVVWSYKPPHGTHYTISFRDGEVNSVSSRKKK